MASKKSKSKKKKKKEKPSPPSFHFDVGGLKEPSSEEFMGDMNALLDKYPEITGRMIEEQLKYAPQLTAAQVANQKALYESMAGLKRAEAPNVAAAESQLLEQYAPQFRQAYASQFADIGKMREVTTRELEAGYDLGDELGREVQQGIRAAQTARGNYLGPAATAQEAMGMGGAAVDRYNTRLAQYGQMMGVNQNFMQGASPISMMGQVGQATGLTDQGIYPNSQVDVGLGAQGFGTAVQGASSIMQGQSNFNNALLSAFGQNAEAGFNTYDRQYEQYLEKLAVKNGLFSQPSVGGGGGGGMQIAGAAIGAVGAIGGGLLAF